MRQIKILTAALLVFLSFSASAIPVSTSVGDFDVTTVSGTANDLLSTLMDQVWWGNSDLAVEFAGLVQDQLGFPNFFLAPESPYFLFDTDEFGSTAQGVWSFFGDDTDPSALILANVSGGAFDPYVYAVATSIAVPEPGTLALFGIGVLGIGAARRRKKV